LPWFSFSTFIPGHQYTTSASPPTSEFGCNTGHFSTAIAAALYLARTLAAHLTLVLTDAKLRQVHIGAGTCLFWVEKGEEKID
jgi:hypothetical protein